MNWNDLSDIDDTPSLSEPELECLGEVQSVLEKHGHTKRFGVTLLHKHFALEENEIMVEEVDRKARTLTIKPRQSTSPDFVNNHRVTSWRFEDGIMQPFGACATGPYGGESGHYGYKND